MVLPSRKCGSHRFQVDGVTGLRVCAADETGDVVLLGEVAAQIRHVPERGPGHRISGTALHHVEVVAVARRIKHGTLLRLCDLAQSGVRPFDLAAPATDRRDGIDHLRDGPVRRVLLVDGVPQELGLAPADVDGRVGEAQQAGQGHVIGLANLDHCRNRLDHHGLRVRLGGVTYLPLLEGRRLLVVPAALRKALCVGGIPASVQVCAIVRHVAPLLAALFVFWERI
mmetsp:Transcript_24963/g.69812  ORF Transcript_24963/g.69812 Transcript_24963/m.69812 type:complete len:226 (+) Transcript_24963:175-852(+)